MSGPSLDVAPVLAAFGITGPVLAVEALAGGHIHATLRVRTAADDVVCQSVNEHVFRDLDACEENLSRIDRCFHDAVAPVTVPRLHRTPTGRVHWRDASGRAWRVSDFATGTTAAVRAGSPDEAYGAARAFGDYVAVLAGGAGAAYDGERPFRETIPGFHALPGRVAAFEAAVTADRVGRLSGCRDVVAQARALLADARVAAPLDGAAPTPVHNDAKIPNLRIDGEGRFTVVVDLDTTMPGSVLFDIGELVRTGCCDAPEDAEDLSEIAIDGARIDALYAGFLDGAGRHVDPSTRALFDVAGPRMAVENAIRFLADHLDGDRYFAVHGPGHNLIRARAQLHLATLLRSRAGT